MLLIDTHCHLTHPRFGGAADDVVARATAAGVGACLTIGTGVEDARDGRELAARHPGRVYCAAGLDPFTAHKAGGRFGEELERLRAMLEAGGFVALGEIGLDYHYDLDPRPVQAERFERQLDLAAELDLPVVIHVRDAHDDMTAILGAHSRCRGVIHSFTAGPREARAYLDRGWHLGFNGVVTFRSAPEVGEAARLVPADRLVLETDSPYLAPAPLRGRRCEPAFAVHTLRRLAELRNCDPGSLASETTEAAVRLFGLPPPLPGAASPRAEDQGRR